jgi:hypothetical protein
MNTRGLVVVFLFLVGCSSSSSNGGGAAPGADGGAGGTGAPGTTALSCSDILDCIGKCPSSDDSCPDACANKGTPAAKDAVIALATCIDKNKCADTDCVGAKCATEIQTCAAAGSGATKTTGGTAPAKGSLPAELVGEWVSSTVLYDFRADGTLARYSEVTTGGCHSKGAETGVGVASGDSLSIYFKTGSFQICDKPSDGSYKPGQEDFTYSLVDGAGINGEQGLKLLDTHCTYTDAANIGLYCTTWVYRK